MGYNLPFVFMSGFYSCGNNKCKRCQGCRSSDNKDNCSFSDEYASLLERTRAYIDGKKRQRLATTSNGVGFIETAFDNMRKGQHVHCPEVLNRVTPPEERTWLPRINGCMYHYYNEKYNFETHSSRSTSSYGTCSGSSECSLTEGYMRSNRPT